MNAKSLSFHYEAPVAVSLSIFQPMLTLSISLSSESSSSKMNNLLNLVYQGDKSYLKFGEETYLPRFLKRFWSCENI
jgi:hypothetical protein